MGLAGWFVRSGRLQHAADEVRILFRSQEINTRAGDGHASLLRTIVADQSRSGSHKGQFGRSASLAEDRAFNPTRERISPKPRMYLTRWPCLILARHRLAPRQVKLAVTGVKNLFKNGYIMGEEEWSQIPGRRPGLLYNYRHTICGALILVEQVGWNSISETVIGRMLERDNQWQNPDGGWAHSSPLPSASDLYSTLYSIQLLEWALNSDRASSLADAANPRIERSLDYLSNCWEANGWEFGSLSSQEIFPQAFIEVADAIRIRRPELHAAVVAELLLQLNPTGGLTEEYLQHADRGVSEERHLARFAYATYCAQQPTATWQRLARDALAGEIAALNSVEAAFLLDLHLSHQDTD